MDITPEQHGYILRELLQRSAWRSKKNTIKVKQLSGKNFGLVASFDALTNGKFFDKKYVSDPTIGWLGELERVDN